VDVVALHAGDLDGDLAVVDQEPVAGFHLPGELCIGARHPARRAEDVVAGDLDGVAGAPLDGGVGEAAQADLRPLQVGEDPHGPPGRLGGLPYEPVHCFVVGVAAVAEVQPGHVHAGVNQPADPLQVRGGRAEGTDDFCATRHMSRLDLAGDARMRAPPS
jgi:hypothetical protein